MKMDDENLYVVTRPDVRTSRKFRRSAPGGMKVWRAMTVNFDTRHTIEHVELECPDYKLTDRGPVFDYKEDSKE